MLLLLPARRGQGVDGRGLRRFDGADGFDERRARVLEVAAGASRAARSRGLPPNDLASSPLAAAVLAAGAFRADVSGAGPAVYGLFHDRRGAERAAAELAHLGTLWVADPAW